MINGQMDAFSNAAGVLGHPRHLHASVKNQGASWELLFYHQNAPRPIEKLALADG